MSTTTNNQLALPTGTWRLDPSTTTITVTATKLGVFKVPAGLTVLSGTIEIGADHQVVSAEVIADAASYSSGNDKRDQHVRGGDFLDTDNHPTITFRTTDPITDPDGAEPAGGTVTVKGGTSPLAVDIEGVAFDAVTGGFEASAQIDRRTIGLGKLPSMIVGHTVSLEVSAKATLGGQA